MSVAKPQLKSVDPGSVSGVVLRQPIVMLFTGPSLIDPRSFGSSTFALYGPGDVVFENGPGTILNEQVETDPYKLIDGPVVRERIPGDFEIYLSGTGGLQTLTSGQIGVSGTIVWGQFTPSVPLKPNTQYEAVIVGDDFPSGYLEGSGRYLGITSWTSDAQFAQSGTATSGTITVQTSYDRILPTNIYDSTTGYMDTYTITITSGHKTGQPKFTWEKESSVGTYSAEGSGIHDVGDNLTFLINGETLAGQVYTLDVFIPRPLEETYTWTFTTSELDASAPPTTPIPESVIIDETAGGTVLTPTTSTSIDNLYIVDSWPVEWEYAVIQDLPVIILEFNKVLDPYLVTSGIIGTDDFPITLSPLMGMPNLEVETQTVYPASLEISGIYLKLWM